MCFSHSCEIGDIITAVAGLQMQVTFKPQSAKHTRVGIVVAIAYEGSIGFAAS
jgi:hypothetical protein